MANAAMPQRTLPHWQMLQTASLLTAAAMPFAADRETRERAVKAISRMTAQMMQGWGGYRDADIAADRPQHPAMWQEGSTTLYKITGARKNAAPVLLVPSLINRANILDLDAQHSFAGFLVGQGYQPYLLDWGPPGDDELPFRVDEYITRRLYPALVQLDKPHVIGYCMGGTMAAGAAAASDARNIRSLTLLAAPWDFHAGDSLMSMRTGAFALSAEPVMQTTGLLPVDWIQALFSSIDPLFAFNKFRAFAGMDADSAEARRFVIVEDWLNDGVALAAPAARQALLEWYGENQPANGVWTIGDRLVDASAITIPTLIVAATGDRLVPEASARALMQQIAAARLITPPVGHIGMMASSRARALVWQPVADFLAAHA